MTAYEASVWKGGSFTYENDPFQSLLVLFTAAVFLLLSPGCARHILFLKSNRFPGKHLPSLRKVGVIHEAEYTLTLGIETKIRLDEKPFSPHSQPTQPTHSACLRKRHRWSSAPSTRH